MASARPRRRRVWLWLVGAVIVVALILVTAGLFSALVTNTRADDPRSPLPTGTAALAQLLTDEGVRVVTASAPADAAVRTNPDTTLVVANAEQLGAEEARRLATASYGRLILLRPTLLGLRRFGVAATTTNASNGILSPDCADRAAVRAGTILVDDARAGYASNARPILSCYPWQEGSAYLRTAGTGGAVDLVAGGVSNETLGEYGNAAFGLNVFGSEPTVVWLMGEGPDDSPTATERPTLLPPWWALALTQTVVALVVVAVWRGRRLGPIMTEPLPVRVRSSETVIGHGRLYYRIGARDRAAEALRAGARARLGRRFGHRFDPDALVASLADRAGQESARVWHLLYGPPPATDDDLATLACDLDQLEQEGVT